jgi:hypothetical protein
MLRSSIQPSSREPRREGGDPHVGGRRRSGVEETNSREPSHLLRACRERPYPGIACAAAAILAFVGAWLAYWFNRLDARSRQLVDAGEDALEVSQERLANLADNQALMILEAMDEPRPGASSYRRVTIIALFLLGAIYAIRLSFK